MPKLITKERLVSGAVGAATLGIGYTLWKHLAPRHDHVAYAEQPENDRGEYGHHKHHHHKGHGHGG